MELYYHRAPRNAVLSSKFVRKEQKRHILNWKILTNFLIGIPFLKRNHKQKHFENNYKKQLRKELWRGAWVKEQALRKVLFRTHFAKH